jgi:hypothetical protein
MVEKENHMATNQPPEQQMSVNVNLDTTPILYTDNVFMTTNSDGLVIDFCQKLGSTNTIRIVSRIGMSREHAKKVVAQLSKLLALTEGQSQTGEKGKN